MTEVALEGFWRSPQSMENVCHYLFFFIQRFYIWYGKEINICLDCKSQCTESVHLARKGGIVFYQPGHDLCKQKHSTIILVEAEIYLD